MLSRKSSNGFMLSQLSASAEPNFDCLPRQNRRGPVRALRFRAQITIDLLRKRQMKVTHLFIMA